MQRWVFPGSFDPVTLGHVDIIERASALCDELVVLVTHNPQKQGLFTPEERCGLVEESVRGLQGVRVDTWSGLLADYLRSRGIAVIIKGLRSVVDYEYELPMARANAQLAGVETVFVPTATGVSHVSSSMAKEIALLGGDVTGMLPRPVCEALARRS